MNLFLNTNTITQFTMLIFLMRYGPLHPFGCRVDPHAFRCKILAITYASALPSPWRCNWYDLDLSLPTNFENSFQTWPCTLGAPSEWSRSGIPFRQHQLSKITLASAGASIVLNGTNSQFWPLRKIIHNDKYVSIATFRHWLERSC